MALTGSMTAACWVGLLVVLGLGFTAMYGLQTWRNKRFWGEVDSVIRANEFTHRMPERIPCKREYNKLLGSSH